MAPSMTHSATLAPPALDELCINTLRYQFGGHEEKAATKKVGA